MVTETSLLLDPPKEKINKPATSFTKFEKDTNNFHEMKHLEPHSIRRKQILEAHPEIEKLFKKQPITMIWVLFIHISQLLICHIISTYQLTYKGIIILAFTLGAILNHALFVLIHDIIHFNVSKFVKLNHILSILTNLPQIIPSAVGFGIYHRDHHHYLGDKIMDPDIPTMWEIKFYKTSLRRLSYILMMPFFYGLRPYFKAPKKVTLWEIINSLCCILYALIIVKCFNINCLYYLLFCTYLSLSIHPVAFHVIAEHYEFFRNQDTYSYYGPINYINFNMGYHIEHHDFPNIAWNKLPEVRKIAPEFYDTFPTIDSYLVTVYKYIFDTTIGPWSRITIEYKDE